MKASALGAWLGTALAAAPLHAAMPRPASVSVDSAHGVRISWQGVDGAQLYRVAVFDAPDQENKRPLLAAVWVRGSSWNYGQGPLVARAAKLASTKPLPLPVGHKLHVMVAAAGADGSDKSDWSGADFVVPATTAAEPALEAPSTGSGQASAAAKLSPPAATGLALSPTAAAKPTASAKADTSSAEAELDISGGDEFKSSPDPTEIDLQDGPKGATPAAAVAAVATPGPPPAAGSLGAGRALLKDGKDEDAEAVFRALLDKDSGSADAWEGLGDSYVDRSMKVEAADAYEKAVDIDKSRTRLRTWLDKNVRP